MLDGLTFQFANEENKEALSRMILSWLEADFNSKSIPLSQVLTQPVDMDASDASDDEAQIAHYEAWWQQHKYFNEQGQPKNHFWYNRKTIEECINAHNAMCVFNEQGLVGYLIWTVSRIRADIQIIEVNDTYRRQGVGRRMIDSLSDQLKQVHVLSGSPLETAQGFYQQMGWHKNSDATTYYKIIRPVLNHSDTLPSGRVLAICPVDYYEVQTNLERYLPDMRYFQLEMNPDRQLLKPIVTAFKNQGYIAIYFNRERIASGKAKHLFRDGADMDPDSLDLFMMTDFIPRDPTLYNKLGFCVDATEMSSDHPSAPSAHVPVGERFRFCRERDSNVLDEQADRLQPRV